MSTQNLHHCQSVQEARNNNNYKHDHKLNKFIKKRSSNQKDSETTEPSWDVLESSKQDVVAEEHRWRL